jgi:glycosyltransferase involved in cell wall biosynthesis
VAIHIAIGECGIFETTLSGLSLQDANIVKTLGKTRGLDEGTYLSPNYTIVMICDFPSGQLPRILALYNSFRRPPRIILVRRGDHVSADIGIGIDVQSQMIPLPAKGSNGKGIIHTLSAMCSVAGYLVGSCITYLRIRSRRKTISLVHAHYVFPQGLFGLILASLLKVPLIVSVVGQDVNEDMQQNAFLRVICSFVLRRARIAITVSAPLKSALERLGITNSIYLPNSVDTDLFSERSERILPHSILFVGVMEPRKRPLTLLHAFEMVGAKVPDAKLIMIGKGYLSDLIQQEIHLKGLADRVKLLPHVKLHHLEELLSQASVFVLPSVYEGMSLALLEAMAAGKIIVASANDSNRSVLHHESQALLFRVDDEKDLAMQILRAITDKKLGVKLSRAARNLCVRQFSNAKIAPRLEQIYLTQVVYF